VAKYLVLGGSGFIGSYLVNYLAVNGNNVDNIDFKDFPENDLRYIEIKNLRNYDGCFFLAWDVGGSKYLSALSTWQAQFYNNICLIHNIFPQLNESKIPFLFVSSQLSGLDDSPYSLTKKVAENYSLTFDNCVVARQWNAYGSIEKYDIKSHVISDFILQAVKNNKIELLSTGTELRKFVHLDDICRGYLQLINDKSNFQKIFDVVDGPYMSILSIAEIVSNLTGAEIIPGKKSVHTPQINEIDKIPNWEAKIQIKDGIRHMLNSLLKF
jgi:nucleoside-diphosphate-sugar epimerase